MVDSPTILFYVTYARYFGTTTSADHEASNDDDVAKENNENDKIAKLAFSIFKPDHMYSCCGHERSKGQLALFCLAVLSLNFDSFDPFRSSLRFCLHSFVPSNPISSSSSTGPCRRQNYLVSLSCCFLLSFFVFPLVHC